MIERSDALPSSATSAVCLSAGWLAHWLPQLAPPQLTIYAALGALGSGFLDHPRLEEMTSVESAALHTGLKGLEAHGLIERLHRHERDYVHLHCRSDNGVHQARPVQPSIREAIAFHKRMMGELIEAASADETRELREAVFERYPELRASFDASAAAAAAAGSPSRQRWRLWRELSRHLLGRFETHFGQLRRLHAPVFKEVSAQLLRLKLEVIERLTQEIVEQRAEIFPTSGGGWIAALGESAFTSLTVVRELSRKYRVGPEQIYLNVVEAFQHEGLVVIGLDDRGKARDLLLPSTTGLDTESERWLFLQPNDLEATTPERVADAIALSTKARRSYTAHLTGRAVAALLDLGQKGRLSDEAILLQIAADRVNESLDLVWDDDAVEAPVTPEDLLDALTEARSS